MEVNFYELLGIKSDASSDIIKRAYHEKARKYHPDLNQDKASAEQFLAIQTAFETLANPEKRKQYDSQLNSEEFTQPVTRMRILTSKKAISRINEDQLIYALMEIECLKTDEEYTNQGAQVCLVIDCSTSMQGNRLEMVKANVIQSIQALNSKDLLSIVTFSDEAEVFLPPTEISNQEIIKAKLSEITTHGGTEIKKGLQAGVDLLWQGQSTNSSRFLVLLTDGHTYGDEAGCFELAKQAAKQGIVLSALGIGNEWNEAFLEKLTASTGGSTLFVNNREILARYLEHLFTSIDRVYAKEMTLFLENNPQVELRILFQIEPNIVQYTIENGRILLGDLYFGKKAIFLMEYLVHPLLKKDKDVELLSGQIKMKLPREKQVNARLFPKIVLSIVDDLTNDQPPDEIARALYSLTLYYMQERSREDVKVGNIVRATRRLNYLASRLIAEGEVRLANRVFSESETILKTHQFSQDGEKELKYGTKMLLSLPNP
jgi:Ca-activated chloride channel family protein